MDMSFDGFFTGSDDRFKAQWLPSSWAFSCSVFADRVLLHVEAQEIESCLSLM